MWVEMSLAPTYRHNFIALYNNEEEWIQNRELCVKRFSLETEVSVQKAHPTCSSGSHVLHLVFKNYHTQLDLVFESMTKMDQWYEALTRASRFNSYHASMIDTVLIQIL